METIVIVGAGQAGGWAAKTLRGEGYAGRIALIGAEPHPPHERPPLSKSVMAGEVPAESTHLFKPEELAGLALDFLPGVRVTAIDRAAKAVALDDGGTVGYDQLILATGGQPRKLQIPGANAARVHYLRTIDDSIAIRARLGAGRRLLIVGGGWIGLEIAATARKAGTDVTVLEAGPRLCGRAAPHEISALLHARHEREGVAFRIGVAPVEILDDGVGPVRVRLAEGTTLEADAVVVGIGLEPDIALAREAGLAVDTGIVVDEACRTSDPDIFAAGDCASMPLACLGRRVRLESWQNAQNQAIAAAKSALGQTVRYDELPWFWSDQYDLNLQILGMPAQWGEAVTRGDPATGKFSLFYRDGERITAIVSVNAPRDLRAAKKLVQTGKPVRAEDLANPTVALQKL